MNFYNINIKNKFKPLQLVKFHTPIPDEDPNQLYVVLEIKEDVERPRADIKAFGTGLRFPPINTVLLDDLEVVGVNVYALVGHKVTINKADYSQETGKVVELREQKIMLDLSKGVKGFETYVWLTIQDENETEHTGTLFNN